MKQCLSYFHVNESSPHLTEDYPSFFRPLFFIKQFILYVHVNEPFYFKTTFVKQVILYFHVNEPFYFKTTFVKQVLSYFHVNEPFFLRPLLCNNFFLIFTWMSPSSPPPLSPSPHPNAASILGGRLSRCGKGCACVSLPVPLNWVAIFWACFFNSFCVVFVSWCTWSIKYLSIITYLVKCVHFLKECGCFCNISWKRMLSPPSNVDGRKCCLRVCFGSTVNCCRCDEVLFNLRWRFVEVVLFQFQELRVSFLTLLTCAV